MLLNRCSQKITLCFNPQKLPKLEINSKKLSGQHKKKKKIMIIRTAIKFFFRSVTKQKKLLILLPDFLRKICESILRFSLSCQGIDINWFEKNQFEILPFYGMRLKRFRLIPELQVREKLRAKRKKKILKKKCSS